MSVVVRLTTLWRSLVQLKLDGLTTRLVIVQLSVEPLSTWAAVMLTLPLAWWVASMVGVMTVGGDRHGAGVGAFFGAIEAGRADHPAGDSAVVARTIVHLGGGDADAAAGDDGGAHVWAPD